MRLRHGILLVLSLAIGVGITLSMAGCGAVGGSSFPTKDITFICAWGQGGAADALARTLAEATSPHLGKQIIVKNVVGGSGTQGAAEVAQAKPDGYTVGQQQTGPILIQPHLQQVPYKWPDDFIVINMVFQQPYVWVVRGDSPFKTAQEVIDDAKKRKEPIRWGGPGVGTGQHLAMEWMAKQNGYKVVQVPFKTAAEGVTALLGGHTEWAVGQSPDVSQHIKEGRLKPVMAFSKFEGMEGIPGLKSAKELGFDIETASWSANVLPKGTPEDVVDKLHTAFEKGKMEKIFVDHTTKTMQPLLKMTPEEGKELLVREGERWAKLLDELGLKK